MVVWYLKALINPYKPSDYAKYGMNVSITVQHKPRHLAVAVFMLNVLPTAKGIGRQGHILRSDLSGIEPAIPGCKASGLSTTPWRPLYLLFSRYFEVKV